MHWHLLTPIRINGNIQYGFNIEYDRTFLFTLILLKLKLFYSYCGKRTFYWRWSRENGNEGMLHFRLVKIVFCYSVFFVCLILLISSFIFLRSTKNLFIRKTIISEDEIISHLFTKQSDKNIVSEFDIAQNLDTGKIKYEYFKT